MIEIMAISNIKALIPCDVKKVWDTVTSLNQYEWRSDLSKIEVIDENQFIEYTKDGLQLHLRLLFPNHANDGNLIWKTAI